MITLATPPIDINTLVDFALGKLSTEDSLKIIQEIERNPQASRDLEFILKLMCFFKSPNSRRE
jgi:hypothetical protein